MSEQQATTGEALQDVRVATQELHQAISQTLSRRASATRDDVQRVVDKGKQATQSARTAMGARHDAAQEAVNQRLSEALGKIESANKRAAEGLGNTGEALHASLNKALVDARASAQSVSEAIAAKRSALAAKHNGGSSSAPQA